MVDGLLYAVVVTGWCCKAAAEFDLEDDIDVEFLEQAKVKGQTDYCRS